MTTDAPAETKQTAEAKAAAPKGRLAGKVCLITGSSRGLGRAIAHAYAAEGAKVAICGRDRESLMGVVKEVQSLGADCLAVKLDLADREDAVKLVDQVQRAFGRIDVLVNNAGILGPRKTIADFPDADWNKVIETNLNSVFWVTKEALGKMIPQNSGSIINVSSGVGRTARAKWGAYAVSKFAVEGLTQVLADEVKDYKVRVNSVNPGKLRTKMRAEAYPGEDPATLPSPADATNVFVYLASDASKGVSGDQFEAKDWMGRADF
ncbi:MAG: SDR family NAD(P)-dependent oxidoreductase [Sumerlaeia bacterium]